MDNSNGVNFREGCQWLAGLVSRVCKGEIVIGNSDNSGGVVVGARVWNRECSRFKSCYAYFFLFTY